MRSLWLLRHAKSDWTSPGQPDVERPLAPRGRRTAPLVGGWLREHEAVFDLVVCSPAARAQATRDLVDPPLAPAGRSVVRQAVYDAAMTDLLELVHGLPADARRVLVIGHNPGLTDLALALAGSGRPSLLMHLGDGLPTAALAVIAFDGEWPDAGPGSGELLELLRPRDLR